MINMRTHLLPILLALAAIPAWSAEMPDDAKNAIESYEKKKSEIATNTAVALAKEHDALIEQLEKLQKEESKAHHSAGALAIKDYLEELKNPKKEEPAKDTKKK
jgi:hypothetical protein